MEKALGLQQRLVAVLLLGAIFSDLTLPCYAGESKTDATIMGAPYREPGDVSNGNVGVNAAFTNRIIRVSERATDVLNDKQKEELIFVRGLLAAVDYSVMAEALGGTKLEDDELHFERLLNTHWHELVAKGSAKTEEEQREYHNSLLQTFLREYLDYLRVVNFQSTSGSSPSANTLEGSVRQGVAKKIQRSLMVFDLLLLKMIEREFHSQLPDQYKKKLMEEDLNRKTSRLQKIHFFRQWLVSNMISIAVATPIIFAATNDFGIGSISLFITIIIMVVLNKYLVKDSSHFSSERKMRIKAEHESKHHPNVEESLAEYKQKEWVSVQGRMSERLLDMQNLIQKFVADYHLGQASIDPTLLASDLSDRSTKQLLSAMGCSAALTSDPSVSDDHAPTGVRVADLVSGTNLGDSTAETVPLGASDVQNAERKAGR